ncbi:MAG: tripartite tricarboxylate transporter substrate binding protein [Burkholderiales bacterium]
MGKQHAQHSWAWLLGAAAFCAATGAGAADSPAGTAASYPNRPIRILVPFSAGSASDIFARTVGARMTEAWNQQVVVDNRPSAGGVIATEAVARATPDGYTLLVVSAGHAVSAALYTNLPYDPVKDFAGVSNLANVPSIMVVAPGSGIRNVKDLIAAAKAKPGELAYASPGIGSANHLATEYFRNLAGVQITHVPYKGIPEGLTAVIGGQVTLFLAPAVNALPLVKDGKLLAIATSTGKRAAVLPDVPTLAEAGVPGYVFDPWFAMLAPAETPRPIVDKLNAVVVRALSLPQVRERLLAAGAEAAPTTPEQLDKHIRAEVAKFKKIVLDAGIKPE